MAFSDYQAQAMMMFPKVTKRFGGLRGDGEFGILNKCGRHWQIWLYPTADEAKEKLAYWASNGCGPDCSMSHEKIRIKPDLEWLDKKFRQKAGLE